MALRYLRKSSEQKAMAQYAHKHQVHLVTESSGLAIDD
jgi:hypothetical protein